MLTSSLSSIVAAILGTQVELNGSRSRRTYLPLSVSDGSDVNNVLFSVEPPQIQVHNRLEATHEGVVG